MSVKPGDILIVIDERSDTPVERPGLVIRVTKERDGTERIAVKAFGDGINDRGDEIFMNIPVVEALDGADRSERKQRHRIWAEWPDRTAR